MSTTVGASLDEVPLEGGDSISVQVLGDRRGSVTIAFDRRVD